MVEKEMYLIIFNQCIPKLPVYTLVSNNTISTEGNMYLFYTMLSRNCSRAMAHGYSSKLVMKTGQQTVSG